MAIRHQSDHAKAEQITGIQSSPESASVPLDGATAEPELIVINQENLDRTDELLGQTTDSAQPAIPVGIEMMTQNARMMGEHMARTFGFGGEEGERLARQSRLNVEAIARCGMLLSQAGQRAWQSAYNLGNKRWQSNFENMNRLGRARTAQEFAMLQSEIMREGLQRFVEDTQTVAETSLRAVAEAGEACSSVKSLVASR